MNRCVIILLLTVTGASCSKAPAATPTTPASASPIPAKTPLDDDAYIRGTVHDTAYRPLAGARVQVLDGPHAGTSATVDSNGEFSMTGTFEEGTTFRATQDGYITATGTLLPSCAPCHPHRWIHFLLDVPVQPVSIAGDYTLTFIADSTCTSLPTELRTRTYTATIGPISPSTSFEIIVSGGEIEEQGGGAGVSGNFVALGFGDPGLIEEVAPRTYLWFYGGTSVTVPGPAATTISEPFDGWIDYCVLQSEPGDYYSCSPAATHTRCQSKNHRLILTRR